MLAQTIDIKMAITDVRTSAIMNYDFEMSQKEISLMLLHQVRQVVMVFILMCLHQVEAEQEQNLK